MRLADTHCHLNFDLFSDDLEQVMDRAREQGVDHVVIPAIDLETSAGILPLCRQYEGLHAAVGVHPNDAAGWHSGMIDELDELGQNKLVVAIGEIGLDYYHDDTPKAVQMQALNAQLTLASELDKPVILHSRQAFDDLWAALKLWVKSLPSRKRISSAPGVLHSFEGSPRQAKEAFDLGFYIGIGGPVTYPKADEKRSVVADLPLDALLLETDAPFLTPHPHRGQRNEPGYVAFVAQKIAAIKGEPLEKVAKITTRNAKQLFHWREDR